MKVFTKKLIALTIIASSFIGCQESTTEDLGLFEPNASLSKEEVLSVVETLIINYPITAVTRTSGSTTLNSDFDLEEYAAATEKPQLNFPFDIVVEGETITINNIRKLKSVIKSRRGKKKPAFVFPISVELADGSAQEIADRNALKDYLDSLDEGAKPVFVFPLSLTYNNQTIEVSDENELKALMGATAKGRRPHLVFPVFVVLEDGSSSEVSDKEEFKVYLETLADGVKPVFIFPITVKKNGKEVVVHSQEEFDALIKNPKKGKRPEFVFPISVELSDATLKVLADLDALKAYHKSLDKGVRAVYVFPLSVIKDGETIILNSQEELEALFSK